MATKLTTCNREGKSVHSVGLRRKGFLAPTVTYEPWEGEVISYYLTPKYLV